MEIETYQAVRPVIVDGKVIAPGAKFKMPAVDAAEMLNLGQIELAKPDPEPQELD